MSPKLKGGEKTESAGVDSTVRRGGRAPELGGPEGWEEGVSTHSWQEDKTHRSRSAKQHHCGCDLVETGMQNRVPGVRK